MRVGEVFSLTLKAGFVALVAWVISLILLSNLTPAGEEHVRLLPHQVARYEDGLSLRFSMVHDTLVERYERHSPTWYSERNRLAWKELNESGTPPEKKGPEADRRFQLLDDIGVGLERLHLSTQAIELMRSKLASQERLGYSGYDLYTTYANLGTFLIHGYFGPAIAGDTEARERVREGQDYVIRSIQVNPEAHFGREEWQANIVDWFLWMLEEPDRLCTSTCLGIPFDTGKAPRSALRDRHIYHPGLPEKTSGFHPSIRKMYRSMITMIPTPRRLVIDRGKDDEHENLETTPFDEPVLGILGMWWLGGGPNPHSAAALGVIMEWVGQDEIAWVAYERALRMADRVSADPDLTARWITIIRDLQSAVGRRLGDSAGLKEMFERELQKGLDYQAAYQEYESRQITAGRSIDDTGFYDQFYRDHGKIASSPGTADTVILKDEISFFSHRRNQVSWRQAIPAGVFGIGIFLFLLGNGVQNWRENVYIPLP